MKKINVVNYHITNRCNYHCAYCFGKFEGQNDPTLEEAKRIIDNIADYFKQCEIENGRINFAGGEPTLYKYLDDLIDYAHSLGVAVSIVTNGSLLTRDRIKAWKGKVSCIGISIDSINVNTNFEIGRCCSSIAIEPSKLIALSKTMHECGIDLKINTVASKLNVNEDLSPLYRAVNPKKIKIFQMHLVNGINDCAKPYKVTDREFEDFCARYREFQTKLVCEPCGSMENSYLMINPAGELQLNNNGEYRTYGCLTSVPLSAALEKTPLNIERFKSRYKTEDVA